MNIQSKGSILSIRMGGMLMKVVSLWRYPVKSMMGEELNACQLTEKGVLGDRAYGVVDKETGKLVNAKNPKKWPNMFRYRAAFTKPIELSKPLPSVRITLPNGNMIDSSEESVHQCLSDSFGREVVLSTPTSHNIEFEGYIPEEIKELDRPGTIFSSSSPNDTFFDSAMVHIITTNTINALREWVPNSRIEPRRFRPNIILDIPNAAGFIEEKWVDKIIGIGDYVKLKITKPTARCVMTTLPQGDLPQDLNVLRALAKHNKGNFGVYAEVIETGLVKVDDKVTIL